MLSCNACSTNGKRLREDQLRCFEHVQHITLHVLMKLTLNEKQKSYATNSLQTTSTEKKKGGIRVETIHAMYYQ